MAYTEPMHMSKVYDDQHILPGVVAKNKDELFKFLAHTLAGMEDLEESLIYESLKAREAMMNTIIAPGIALPHAQIKNLGRATGLLAIIPAGCDYGSPQDIKIAAMIIDDEGDTIDHLDTLRNFALLARNPRFLEKCLEAKTPQEIHQLLKRFEAQG